MLHEMLLVIASYSICLCQSVRVLANGAVVRREGFEGVYTRSKSSGKESR